MNVPLENDIINRSLFVPLSRASSLEEILDRRERRRQRQCAELSARHRPLVSFTVNMPGAVKDNAATRLIFQAGVSAVHQCLMECNGDLSIQVEQDFPTGPEALFSVAADPLLLKRTMIGLEEGHPLGRLFDLDVLKSDGTSVSRTELGLANRLCLLCASPATECARSRKHPLEDLLEQIRVMVTAFQALKSDSTFSELNDPVRTRRFDRCAGC